MPGLRVLKYFQGKTRLSILLSSIICIVALYVLIISSSIEATTIVPVSLEESVQRADLIIIGTVTDARVGEKAAGFYYSRLLTVRVESVLKGKPDMKGKEISVWMASGGPVAFPFPPVTPCEIGGKLLLHLSKKNETTFVSYDPIPLSMPSDCKPNMMLHSNFALLVHRILEICRLDQTAGLIQPSTPKITIEEQVSGADYILIGTVISERNEFKKLGVSNITDVTLSTLAVEQVIKGTPDIEQVVVRTEIGAFDRLEDWIWDTPGLAVSDKVLVFLKRSREEFSVLGGQYGVIYLDSKWKQPDRNWDGAIWRIIGIMLDRNLPISMSVTDWIYYPPLAPLWIGSCSLVALFPIFGIAIWLEDRRRVKNGLPHLKETRWNIIDWFYVVIWVGSTAFSIYIIAATSNPWWFGLVVIIIFWGSIIPMAIKRYFLKCKRP